MFPGGAWRELLGHESQKFIMVSPLERAVGSIKTHEASAGESWHVLNVENADSCKSYKHGMGAANKGKLLSMVCPLNAS